MKVCILANNLNINNGGGRFASDLIKYFKKKDINIIALTTSKSDSYLEKAIIYPNKIKLALSLFKIRKIIKKCDVVHSLDVFPYGLVASIASIGLKKKKIITAIGSGSVKPLYNFWYYNLLKWTYKTSNKITAISHYTADEVLKKVPGVKIDIINPGINYEYFSNLSSKTDIRDCSVNYPYILSVGAIKPRKGYHLSLKVFEKISKIMPELKYIIVGFGRGNYYKELKSLIKDLKIENKVIFKDRVSDSNLASLYKNAKLFLLLPHDINHDIEGFGLVFVEAAFFNCPSVGSKNSGAEDAIINNKTGLLVKNTDTIDHLAEIVFNLIKTNQIKINMKGSTNDLIKKMDWDIIINKYIKIYELLLR